MNRFTWKLPREGVIDARKMAGGVLLVIRAEDPRRTSTGMHAKVTVAIAQDEGAAKAIPITSDVLNTDKEEQRHSFINVLYGIKGRRDSKFTADFIEAYPRADFEQDLYDFSEEYYGQLVGYALGEHVQGDTEKTKPDFIADGLVLRDGGTIMYAPPKSAKSYTAMLLAVSMQNGISSLFRVQQAKVMYLNLERGKDSMSRRLGLVNRVLGLPAEHPLLMLNRRGRSLSDVYDAAKETVEKEHVECVILDSLSRVGFGDLNGNEEVNKSMDYLNRLCPSWLAIGHTSKADETSIFGSMMFAAAMDIGVNIRRQRLQDGTLGVGFHVKDTNDTGVPPLRILAYEFDEYGLSGVREARSGEFSDIEDGQDGGPRSNRQRVYDQFRAFGRSSVSQVAKDLGMNAGTAHTEVSKMVTDGTLVQVGKDGRSILYGIPASNYEGQS